MFSLHAPLQRQNVDDGSRKGPYVEVTLRVIGDDPKAKDRAFTLDGSNRFIKVGRASDRNHPHETPLDDNCHIESPIVSRKHARFWIGDRSQPVWLIDDGSTHGTYIDEVKLLPGVKKSVENGAIIKFGEEVINGTRNYFPSMFQVSFVWHTPAMADPFRPTAFHQRLGIQAPIPASDSEEEDDDTADRETPLPTVTFPSANMMNSSNFIDLTDEPEIEMADESAGGDRDVQPAEEQHEPETIPIYDEMPEVGTIIMNTITVPKPVGEQPKTISPIIDGTPEVGTIITETITTPNLAKRSYRFVYDESDPEEEAEVTSQGSPVRDYDSLYDVSDESDASSSVSSLLDEIASAEPEQKLVPGQDDADTLHQPQNGDKDEVQDLYHPLVDPPAISPVQEQSNYILNQMFKPTTNISDSEMQETDISTANQEVSSSEADDSESEDGSPTYEEALEWFGLGDVYTAHQVVDLAEAKIAANEDDESHTLMCVSALVDGTSDDEVGNRLWKWIEDGGTPLTPIRVELEMEREYGYDNATCISLLPMISTTPLRSPTPGTWLPGTSSYLTASSHPAAFGDVESQFGKESSSIPDSFDAPTNSAPSHDVPDVELTSSSVMRISNLVETRSAESEQRVLLPLAAKFTPDELVISDVHIQESPKFSVSSLKPSTNDPEPDSIAGQQQQDNSAVDQEYQQSEGDAICAGQKRKLDQTEFEEDEEDSAAVDSMLSESAVSMPVSEAFLQDAQVLSQQPINHNDSAEVQTLSQTPVMNANSERVQPPKHKRRHIMSRPRPGFVKTLATHVAAGALGAFGLVAAIVATTPLSLQEELLFGNP